MLFLAFSHRKSTTVKMKFRFITRELIVGSLSRTGYNLLSSGLISKLLAKVRVCLYIIVVLIIFFRLYLSIGVWCYLLCWRTSWRGCHPNTCWGWFYRRVLWVNQADITSSVLCHVKLICPNNLDWIALKLFWHK